MSWRHPRSCNWHQLDLVITTRTDVSSVLHTRSYHSTDCNTDHSLVASKVRLKPRKIHHGKTRARPRINAGGIPTPLRLRASPTASRRNLLRNQQPATRMPNGLISVMPSSTQPWLHSTRKNTRRLTDSRLAGKKCSQSRRPRGKRCWPKSRTLPQAHATPFEQLGARPADRPLLCQRVLAESMRQDPASSGLWPRKGDV